MAKSKIAPYTYHCHSTYSDGKNTPEEMIREAIAMGSDSIGFSDHYFANFETGYDIKREKINEYKSTLYAFKEQYKGEIDIFVGTELDYFSPNVEGFEYIIGSVHWISIENELVAVDYTARKIIDASDKYFDGDRMLFAKRYYETVIELAEKFKFDIVGHIDLVTKFNEKDSVIDTSDRRYMTYVTDAVDALIPTGAIFEINTGAISRGYRTMPYPQKQVLEYIRSNGGEVIYSSDAHSKSALFCEFDSVVEYARSIGYKSIKKLGKKGFFDVEI